MVTVIDTIDTNSLLKKLKNNSWLEDWDCISYLKLSKINEFFKEQYEKEKNLPVDDPQRKMLFKLPIQTHSYKDPFSKGKYDHVKLEIYLGPVNIFFDEKVSNRMKIEYDIVNGPNGQSYLATWQNEKEKDDIEPADSKKNIEPNTAKIIGENVVLEDVPGLVKTPEGKEHKTQQVILNFKSAAFKFFKIKYLEDIELASRLQTWISLYFTNSKTHIKYPLGEVVFRDDNVINALQPESFSFATNKYAFMIYIKTKADDLKRNHPSIMPKNIDELHGYYLLPSDHEAALYINSRIIFDEIIAKNIGGGIKASGIRNEDNPKGIWMLKLDEDWTFSSETITVRSGTQTVGAKYESNVNEIKQVNNISMKRGFKFRAESDLKTLNLHIRENWDQPFVCDKKTIESYYKMVITRYTPVSAIATLSLDYKFSVGPLSIDPKTQIIEFPPGKSQDQPKISIIVNDETQGNWFYEFL
ncbi:3938_t:CDS:1, partial [Cetraspora pellucida]